MSPQPDQHDGPKLRGFTIVELLIVIAVIILLLSILIVAVNAATRTAQSANTRTLMNSMKQALVRFKADIGYYPPVLGDVSPTDFTPDNHDLRKLFDPRGEDLIAGTADDILPLMPDGSPNPNYSLNVQAWYSVTTPADYLIGYGNDQQDAYEGLGIRHPGPDAVWEATIYGAADGSLGARNAGTGPASAGKVYGPYLELKDERLLGSTNGTFDPASGNPRVFFPGEGNYNPDHPKIIVDYWGNPIRYYRRIYPAGALQSSYRSFDPLVPTPTLSDVFVLRPFDLKPGSAIDGIPDQNPNIPGRDTSTTHALRTAEFALLSAGPDRALDQDVRRDAKEFNKDNIVELGP